LNVTSGCRLKILCKIKQDFTENQKNLFIASFYCYLNYDQIKDFVIDLRNVWNWLGFSRIEHCKVVLLKHFMKDLDYIICSYTEEAKPGPEVAVAGIKEAIKAPPIGGALNNEVKK
jgi:hypothetical protein